MISVSVPLFFVVDALLLLFLVFFYGVFCLLLFCVVFWRGCGFLNYIFGLGYYFYYFCLGWRLIVVGYIYIYII